MRFQKDRCPCGPTAALNALECHGVTKISGRTMVCRCGTDDHGNTDGNDIINGIQKSGFKTRILAHADKGKAFAALHAALNRGCPVILNVDHWKHWVVAVGKLKERIVVFDSTRTKANFKKNGIYNLTKRRLFNRWHWDENNRYYGIVVRKPARLP